MTQITTPGIYDLTNEQYHADPCDPMSLSASGAKQLIQSCPARFIYDRTHDRPVNRNFDIGTATHLIVLEPEKFDTSIRVIKANDWKGKAAKEEAENARSEGLIPFLEKEAAAIRGAHDALWRHPLARAALKNGDAEKSLFWQDGEFGIWCRSRPDYLPRNGKRIFDYKTASSASPDEFGRSLYRNGYHQQAAWYLDGYEAVTGERPDEFWFIVQEKAAPYLVSFYRIDPLSIEIGRALNRKAKGIFRWCLDHGEWPGYVPEIGGKTIFFDTHPPQYLVREYENALEAGSLESPEQEYA